MRLCEKSFLNEYCDFVHIKMLPKFLASSYPLEKQYFKIPRWCLSVLGFYPETQRTLIVKMWSFVNFSVLAYSSLTSFYFGLLEFGPSTRSAAFEAICANSTGVMSLLKMLCIWYYRDEFKYLIERIRKLLESQNSTERTKTKKLYLTTATRLVFVQLFLGCSTATCYVLRSDVISWIQYIQNRPFKYEMPYDSVFPDFFEHMPWFPIAFIISHWYGYITVLCFVAGDGLFCCFCFYITTLLKLLAMDLEYAFEKYSKEHDQFTEDEIYTELARFINHYNEIAEITAEFSAIMSFLTLSHFITASMVIGISAANLFLFPSYNIILYVFYTITVICETFLYCIGGTLVMQSSEDLATIAYFTPWYARNLRIQKTILTLIIRTQRSLVIKVPFFAPSMPVLTSILRTTGSLVALFNSLI